MVAYVNTATASTAAAATTITQNDPASIVNADLLLWDLSQSIATAVTPTTPSGWAVWQAAQIVGTAGTLQLLQIVWYRFAASEPASYTLSGLSSGRYASSMAAYRGVHQTTPQDVTPTVASSTTAAVTPAAITPVTPGALIVAHETANAASGVINTTYTSTNLTNVTSVSSTAGAATNAGQGTGWSAWTSGAFTPNLVPSGTISRSVAVTSALRPALSPRPVIFISQAVGRAAGY